MGEVMHREFGFSGCRDVRLFAQAWLPTTQPRAVIVLSHGLAEHSGRYRRLAERLASEGYVVYALDHRGHGRSGGRRASIERFEYLVTDLGTLLGRSLREHPNLPGILLGHSMGGAVALGCALRHHSSLNALVLSAPALSVGEAVPAARLALVRLLATLSPNTGALTLPAASISRDPATVRAYEEDPLVHRGSIPARTVAELLRAMSALQARAHELRLPVLVQHGGADALVPLAATQPVYRRLGAAEERTLRVYEGLYHEVYNEPEREHVIGDLLRWLAR